MKLRVLLVAATVMLSVSCAPKFQGTYNDPNEVEIVDDKWNETDARKTAEYMIAEVVSKPWLDEFRSANKGKKPFVIVDDMENRTDEHIDTKTLTEFMRDELINSRKVRFLNESARKKVLDEIDYQNSGAVRKKDRGRGGRQYGSDYLLGGAVSSSVHSQGGLKTVTYQVVLNLTNIVTGEMEWSGKRRIKKRFKRSGANW